MEWIEERIDEDKHFLILGDFICGADDPLNDFLSDKAIAYDRDRLGNTYIFLNESEILGYYTIKTNAIQVKHEESGITEYDAIPMVEIARIAVSHEIQGLGFGKRMFYDYIVPKVKEIGQIAAVSGIMVFVEEHNDRGIAFYESVGFVKADDAVQKFIDETFNEKCILYTVSLEILEK